ncbi:C2 calcium-dependent membrane targeting [Artemisia annua]|uniref:C2 calcium-dependent membrane targeting n=1 Tax=Artemisia annua TaxID=35608 RepID=A0A2U1NL14_ARTAN|nr:C2 calcium-dependent membrane targeting [Artemisia annua]
MAFWKETLLEHTYSGKVLNESHVLPESIGNYLRNDLLETPEGKYCCNHSMARLETFVVCLVVLGVFFGFGCAWWLCVWWLHDLPRSVNIHQKSCGMDESAHDCSDYRPTTKQLWKPPIGTIELGIVGCKNLLPMKSINGRGSTDAYAVAKYGNKWIRTQAISDNLDPKCHEQYTWRVYDPPLHI